MRSAIITRSHRCGTTAIVMTILTVTVLQGQESVVVGRDEIGIRAHGFVGAVGGDFITIDAPRAVQYTVVFGVDEAGRSVGGYVDGRGQHHGFLRDGETFRVNDFPGAAATFAARINAQGQIVGAYSDVDPSPPALELPHGFLFDLTSGEFTTIDVPDAVRTQPFGINSHGQTVGEYVDAAGRSHGFLLDNGVFTTIDAPDSEVTIAFDIDDNGHIVGIAGAPDAIGGFRRDAEGRFAAIEVPNSTATVPFGINNSGHRSSGTTATRRAYTRDTTAF